MNTLILSSLATLSFALLCLFSVSPSTATAYELVPLPAFYSLGATTLVVKAKAFQFTSNSKSMIITSGIERYTALMFSRFENIGNAPAGSSFLDSLTINVMSEDETLQYGIDESYNITVPSSQTVNTAILTAQTVFGALRGLETFSQLVGYNATLKIYTLKFAPWTIKDAPRFSHRGMLIDSSRHFLPVNTLKGVIATLSYAKFNVLHWHIEDLQSFPVETPKFPALWNGAYSEGERYTIEDVQEVVEFARIHGVRVVPEIDIPGHAASWCVGYPDICPAPNCTMPLDPSQKLTYDVIEGIIDGFSTLFFDDFFHLGGDEVDETCWTETPRVADYLKAHNYTTDDAYMNFVSAGHTYVEKNKRSPVNWEEVFDHFGSKLDKQTIVHVWLDKQTLSDIVAAGYRGILSDQDLWYLDHLGTTWDAMYMNEPLASISDPAQQALVLGGEACMWGETVDTSDIYSTIWPRAAAVAERLWSPQSVNSTEEFHTRLYKFRCLLNSRGVPAAPVDNDTARQSPPGPGSCFEQ